MINNARIFLFVASTILTSCGGGGGGGAGGNYDAQYPFSTLISKYVSNSSITKVGIEGSVTYENQYYAITGSANINESTTAGSFNGLNSLRKTTSTTGYIYIDGFSQPINDVTYYHYNSNYQPLGYTNASIYCLSSNVKPIPMLVSAGQSGEWYTTDCYTNSSRSVKVGKSITTYEIVAVTDKTADLIINQNFISSSGQNYPPAKLTYRISTFGDIAFREQSANLDFNGATLSLIIKAN